MLVFVPLYFFYFSLSLVDTLLVGFFFMGTGLGITMGYHRLLSHQAFKTHPALKFVLLILGAMGIQNSAIHWCSDHRRHHIKTDQDEDPYNAKRGFWYSHILWIFWDVPNKERLLNNVPDLMQDKLVMWQHRHYLAITIVANLLLLFLAGSVTGNYLGIVLFAGLVRIVVNHQLTFFINSLAHYLGGQPYSKDNSSRDNFWIAFLTYGEGFHNFHHKFPHDFRNGIKWYHFDPSKWIIYLGVKMKLISSIYRTPMEAILKARVSEQKKRLVSLFTFENANPRDRIAETLMHLKKQIASAEESMLSAFSQLQLLRSTLANNFHEADFSRKRLKRTFAVAKKNAQVSYRHWMTLVHQYIQLAPAMA
jgi:stearoyl-CoA desaturase (delta-9 desaturase)